ncbi:MAG: TonB-dependent receptor [Cellvibrionaceae bacterium]|nr:TonB-dependent receptor [Cellvibrionaceae bacterium]
MRATTILAALLLPASFSHADSKAKPDLSNAVMEEVIVTATKRGPIAAHQLPTNISVITSDSLGQINAAGLEDFSKYLAGVSIYSNGAESQQINVRGMASYIGAAQVGIYYDEIPAAGQGARLVNQVDMALYDIEQIEFLRGPQGTLYGSGSQGGTVRYISAKPDLDGVYGSLASDLSSQGRGGHGGEFKGMINAPIIEGELGLRAVGFYKDADGYVDRPDIPLDNSNDEVSKGGRVLARWQIAENTRLDLANWYQVRKFGDVSEVTPEDDVRLGQLLAPTMDTVRMQNLSLQHDFDVATINFSYSRYHRDFYKLPDYSGVFNGAPASNVRERETEVNSFELRLASKGAGPMQGVVGLFYQDRDFVDRNKVYRYAAGEFSIGPNSKLLSHTGIDEDFENKAIFGELSYVLNEQWELLAGLRSFRISSVNQQSVFFAGGQPGPGALPSLSSDFNDSVLKLQLNYQYNEDIHSYIVFSQGFREGGVNRMNLTSMEGQPVSTSYDPDFVDNFEWAVKSRLFQGQLMLNSSLYYMLWDDAQTQALDNTMRVVYTVNTEDVKLYGLELESQWLPDSVPGFSLHSNLAYNKQQLTNDTPFYAQLGIPGAGRKGDNLPYTYRLSAGLVAEKSFSLGELEARLGFNINYRGKANTSYNMRDPIYSRRIKAHSFVGANFDLEADNWSLGVYIKNLLDKRTILTWYPQVAPGRKDWVRSSQPRTIGLKASYHF